MDDLVTTGQLIDTMKIGDIAEAVVACEELTVIRTEEGLKCWDDWGKFSPFTLDDDRLSYKWRILPKFVTFEKAYEAGKQGKKVKFLHDDGTLREVDFDICIEDNKLSYYTLKDLIEGKWIVEN